MSFSQAQMLDWLKGKGVRIAGVTSGEKGLFWSDESGATEQMPSLNVPKERIVDTSGAGDVFHGAYCWSFLERPRRPGERISISPARLRPTRSSISAMRRACRRGPTSKRPGPSFPQPKSELCGISIGGRRRGLANRFGSSIRLPPPDVPR